MTDQQNIKETVTKIVSFMNTYRSQRYIEYEIRLGRSGEYFETNMNKRHYQLVSDAFSTFVDESGKKIEPILTTYTAEYDVDNRRKIDDKVIEKKRLGHMDFEIKNSPFDIRVSVSKEQPVKKFGPVVLSMNKERASYKYKNWSYDLTITDNSKYSVEIELDTKKILADNMPLFIYSTLMKICDISLMCEKDSKPGQFILVSE
jgi:hypothetical protein